LAKPASEHGTPSYALLVYLSNTLELSHSRQFHHIDQRTLTYRNTEVTETPLPPVPPFHCATRRDTALEHGVDQDCTCMHAACRYERSSQFAANQKLVAACLPFHMADTCYARASLSEGLVCLMHHIEKRACLEPWPACILVIGVQRHGTPGDSDYIIYCQAANTA
jgi:hypothetical protein